MSPFALFKFVRVQCLLSVLICVASAVLCASVPVCLLGSWTGEHEAVAVSLCQADGLGSSSQ